MASSTLRVLLLDDNPHDRDLTRRELRKEFADLLYIEPLDQREFQHALTEAEFDIVITDYNLQWSNGVDIVRAVKTLWPQCPVIMFTATGTQEVAVEAMKAGLDDDVIKSAKDYIRLQWPYAPALIEPKSACAPCDPRRACKPCSSDSVSEYCV